MSRTVILLAVQLNCRHDIRATYEGVSESLCTGRLERELEMVQLSATRCVQLYGYFMSQSSEFCRHNSLCCFLASVYCCCLFRY
jgi:hypothetical protein